MAAKREIRNGWIPSGKAVTPDFPFGGSSALHGCDTQIGTVNNFSHISLGARQAGRIDCRSFKAVVVPVGLVGNAERFPSNPQAHPMLIASSVIS